jgi:hypothetical protein
MCKAFSVQQHVKWQRLAGSLMSAARTGRSDLIALATDQLEHALSYPPFAHVKLDVGNQKEPTARTATTRTSKRSWTEREQVAVSVREFVRDFWSRIRPSEAF